MPPTSANAYAVSVTGPDGSGLAGSQGGGGFAYPADGSVVSVGSSLTSLSSNEDDGTAYARAEISDVSLFGGEITVGIAAGGCQRERRRRPTSRTPG